MKRENKKIETTAEQRKQTILDSKGQNTGFESRYKKDDRRRESKLATKVTREMNYDCVDREKDKQGREGDRKSSRQRKMRQEKRETDWFAREEERKRDT